MIDRSSEMTIYSPSISRENILPKLSENLVNIKRIPIKFHKPRSFKNEPRPIPGKIQKPKSISQARRNAGKSLSDFVVELSTYKQYPQAEIREVKEGKEEVSSNKISLNTRKLFNKKSYETNLLTRYRISKLCDVGKKSINIQTLIRTNNTNEDYYSNYANENENNNTNNINSKTLKKYKSTAMLMPKILESYNRTMRNPNMDKYYANFQRARNKYSLLFPEQFSTYDKITKEVENCQIFKEKKLFLEDSHSKAKEALENAINILLDLNTVKKKGEYFIPEVLKNIYEFFSHFVKIEEFILEETKEQKKIFIKNLETYKNSKMDDNKYSSSITNLKKMVKAKQDQIEEIKNMNRMKNNSILIQFYQMKNEQRDLLNLLDKTKGYYNQFEDTRKDLDNKIAEMKHNRYEFKETIKAKNFNISSLEDEKEKFFEELENRKMERTNLLKEITNLKEIIHIKDAEILQFKEQNVKYTENFLMYNEEINSFIGQANCLRQQIANARYENEKLNEYIRKNLYED